MNVLEGGSLSPITVGKRFKLRHGMYRVAAARCREANWVDEYIGCGTQRDLVGF